MSKNSQSVKSVLQTQRSIRSHARTWAQRNRHNFTNPAFTEEWLKGLKDGGVELTVYNAAPDPAALDFTNTYKPKPTYEQLAARVAQLEAEIAVDPEEDV